MLKIGDFSKLTHVSIRMLRHYDELGLLKPAHIDPETGYRYYSADQLPRLNRILTLQDLGFSLRQIADLLQTELTPDMLRGMLLQKQVELADRVREEQERLSRVAARLRLLDDAAPAYDVRVKEVPAQWVAAVRGRISGYSGVRVLYDPLFAHVLPLGIQGLTAVIWHDDSHADEAIDAEALILLPGSIPASAAIRVYELPAVRMVSVVHAGAYQTLSGAYDALLHWLAASPYQIAGPNREIYLHYALPARQDDDTYVTEIQFPIVSKVPAGA